LKQRGCTRRAVSLSLFEALLEAIDAL
jgi:hypothetical protein